jgi:hypothetical protein
MSLISAPAVEHATLPDGATVTVWVGVPNDGYIDKHIYRNVDLQLREGDNVLATVTTVLNSNQEHEAHELAREVRAALEAGTIGLYEHDLEPFADRLR